jgi:hypothetical protein
MTEQWWLECADPQAILAALWGIATDRELRLFAVACCRRTRTPLRSKRTGHILELAERLADGEAVRGELDAAREAWFGRLDPVVMGA